MRRCRVCVLPNTKPDLWFDDNGVCAACANFRNRPHVNWVARQNEFRETLSNLAGSGAWDCIVPASGGKDSTYQILKIIEEGFRPLAVTATTCDLSPIGQRNIENLKKLGVDHIQVSPNPRLRAKLNRFGLEEVGDIAWPEHVGIFTVPVRMAVALNIPVIIWGENSQNEYGGPESAAQAPTLTRRWLEEFGGLLGLRVSDLPDSLGLEARDLELYTYPSDEELARVGVTGLFLGHYFPWDGMSNALIAQANGFETHGRVIEGSGVDYENLDNFQHGIHDYFKFLKFGFGRATDIVSMHIRRGRMSREQGMEIVRARDGKYPWTYLDKPLEKILQPLELSLAEFDEICDRFTTKHLFQSDNQGNLVRDRDRNLVLIEEE
jgi:N-acetyl sugar amidotransferase